MMKTLPMSLSLSVPSSTGNRGLALGSAEVSFRHSVSVGVMQFRASRYPGLQARSKRLPVAAFESATAAPPNIAPAITLTDKALDHLKRLKADQNSDICLRVGVRKGGCSGMSYVMDFEDQSKVKADDSIIDYEGFTLGKQLSFVLRVAALYCHGKTVTTTSTTASA